MYLRKKSVMTKEIHHTALAMHQVSEFAQAQEQAEPVAKLFGSLPVYDTTPAQRPWVGLTDEDFLEACQLAERGNYLLAFQRIQIKLKERNND